MSLLRRLSIRARLGLLAVVLLAGLAAITLLAGRQIATAAQADFENSLARETRLLADGLARYVTWPGDCIDGMARNDALAEVISAYEAQTANQVILSTPLESWIGVIPNLESLNITIPGRRDRDNSGGEPPTTPGPDARPPAENRDTVLVDRDTADGATISASAALRDVPGIRGVPCNLRLIVPAARLDSVVMQRALTLGAIILGVTMLASAVVVIVARSIVGPLSLLRDSALRLSQGDLAHRVDYDGHDEIGDVADAFNEMAGQVQRMIEEQRAFASNTSHELRTPLTAMRLRSEALRYDPSLDAHLSQQYIVEIDQEIMRLTTLVDELTLLSRLDAGRAELGQGTLDLLRFAESMLMQVRPLADAAGVTLEAPEASTQALPVQASLTHLVVVFRNLLENAIKYTPAGGTVSWTLEAGAGGVRSVIRDTGAGIAPEDLPRLFQRFYRADKSRSRDVPGTGLGLALVQSVLHAYGGTIRVTSAGLGQGTRVEVFWPRGRIAVEEAEM
jgi:signal transduction histidine kinase